MAIKSYKTKSKIGTLIAFIAAFIVYVGKDELAKLLPAEYAFLAGFIVIIAGYIVAQGTENKRVDVAETLVHAQYNNTEDIDPTQEYEDDSYPAVGDDTSDIEP
ncbi:MAG: hypothetical protein J6M91_06430 [Methanobrevibacter sp.]|nr:hypothetical protein [Methanobrevibacter sp.]